MSIETSCTVTSYSIPDFMISALCKYIRIPVLRGGVCGFSTKITGFFEGIFDHFSDDYFEACGSDLHEDPRQKS